MKKFLGLFNGYRKAPAPQKALPSLAACLAMDALGMATFALPLIGESFDLLWAPISAMLYAQMFGFKRGSMATIFAFAEEILPFTDVIPTFTITWMVQRSKQKNAAPETGYKTTLIVPGKRPMAV